MATAVYSQTLENAAAMLFLIQVVSITKLRTWAFLPAAPWAARMCAPHTCLQNHALTLPLIALAQETSLSCALRAICLSPIIAVVLAMSPVIAHAACFHCIHSPPFIVILWYAGFAVCLMTICCNTLTLPPTRPDLSALHFGSAISTARRRLAVSSRRPKMDMPPRKTEKWSSWADAAFSTHA